MSQQPKSKQKLLYVLEILNKYSNKENILTMKQIKTYLEEEGIKDPAVAKEIYARLTYSMREYPIPEIRFQAFHSECRILKL